MDLCQALLHEHYTVGLGLKAPHGLCRLTNVTLRVLESAGVLTCIREGWLLREDALLPCSPLQNTMQEGAGFKT